MSDNNPWQTKLAARLHDPAEKALVLLRDPAGHENGTTRALTRLLGLEEVKTDSIDPDSRRRPPAVAVAGNHNYNQKRQREDAEDR